MSNLWNIKILNQQCPFLGSVKKTSAQFYPCLHELNHRKHCEEIWCPLTDQVPEVKGPFDVCPVCEQEIPEGRPAIYIQE